MDTVWIHLELNPSTPHGWEYIFAMDKEEIRFVCCTWSQGTNSPCGSVAFSYISSSDGEGEFDV